MRRILVSRCRTGALLSLLAATFGAGGCSRHVGPPVVDAQANTAAEPSGEALNAVEAALRPWPYTVRVQGTLIEDESAELGAKVAGRIKEVMVDLGTRVDEGQPVARLDTEEFDLRVQQAEAQVAQARATLGLKGNTPDDKLDPTKAAPVLQEMALLEEARLNFNRVRGASGKAVFTQEEIQTRQAALHVAEARYSSSLNAVQEQVALLALRRSELALAVQNQHDAVLKAPFVGIIQQKHVAPGSYVSVGQPVVMLMRIDPLRFRAGVPERAAVGVSVGQTVKIFLDGQPAPIEVKISRISPALDLSSRALMIEADVENGESRWRSGLFAEGEILVDAQQQALTVPVSSVVAFGGVEKVWTVKGDKAEPRPVRIGRRDARFVEILGGLSAGDVVLSDGRQGREGVVHVNRDTAEPSDKRAALQNTSSPSGPDSIGQ
jgi:RND family efflux transporter MFP subunit